MGKQLFFAFAGTGIAAKQIKNGYKDNEFGNDVVRIYFNGCQDSAIGGQTPLVGYVSPNLDTVASKIHKCFKDGELSLTQLKKEFGSSIIIDGIEDESSIEIDSINLAGFSRGAVTTFAVARHLDDLDIPISLFASDPVPGNSKQNTSKTSEFYKNYDLSNCKNITHAAVILGAYKKNVNPIHNKFFRQMAPFFGANCDHSLYVVPKEEHLAWSPFAENQEQEFFSERGILTNSSVYVESADRLFFIPKILQQKFHVGIEGRTELSTRYKNKLLDEIRETYPEIRRSDSVKIGQALYALELAPEFDMKEKLEKQVKKNNPQSKALREFIVEFENINQYVFKKKSFFIVNNFRAAVYQLLANYPINDASPQQKQALHDDILNSLRQQLKKEIPKKYYSELHSLMQDFLKDNVIFHPDLVQYIDESETYKRKPTSSLNPATALADIKSITNPDELAARLYHMSERSRLSSYGRFASNLPNIVQNAEQLGNIIRFLSPEKIEKTLKNTQIKQLLANFDAVNVVMDKLFTHEQRKQVFTAIKDNINTMNPDFAQLGKLMQYLSFDKNKQLVQLISFDKVKAKSCADIIHFFAQLTPQQIKQLMPVMADKLQEYLAKAKPKDLHTVYTFLQDKMEDEFANIPANIFPLQQAKTTQNKFKAELQTICEDARSNDEETNRVKI